MPELYTNFRWGFTGEEQFMLVDNGKVIERGPSELFTVHSSHPSTSVAATYYLPLSTHTATFCPPASTSKS